MLKCLTGYTESTTGSETDMFQTGNKSDLPIQNHHIDPKRQNKSCHRHHLRCSLRCYRRCYLHCCLHCCRHCCLRCCLHRRRHRLHQAYS